MTKRDTPTSNADFEGYIPDLLMKLAAQPDCDCNFTLKLVKDGKYGVQGKRMDWSGMIGEVIRGVRIPNASVLCNGIKAAKAYSFEFG